MQKTHKNEDKKNHREKSPFQLGKTAWTMNNFDEVNTWGFAGH